MSTEREALDSAIGELLEEPEYTKKIVLGFVYEVWPCTEDDDHQVVQCEESEADYWGLYERPIKPDAQGARCAVWVADFARKEDALNVAELFQRN